MASPPGTISASLIILIVVALAIGAIIGMSLEGVLGSTRLLAVVAALLATVIASIARYKLVFLGAGVGTDESRIPWVLVVNAAIASIAGGLAAHDISNIVLASPSGVLIGGLAGLVSAVLMALLMVTYHSNPNPSHGA